jgi:hypothetical protein
MIESKLEDNWAHRELGATFTARFEDQGEPRGKTRTETALGTSALQQGCAAVLSG